MSEESNNLENSSTSLCTFVQDDSNENDFQTEKEIEPNTINKNDNLKEKYPELMIEEILGNIINNDFNDEEIIDSRFQPDINSNYLNQRKLLKDKEKGSKENLEEKIPNQTSFFEISQLKKELNKDMDTKKEFSGEK